MSTKSSNTRTNRGPTEEAVSGEFVRLGTQVPAKVKEHYVAAARRHGVSLSIYFEKLAKVDPLAHAPLPEETGQDSEKT